MKLTKKLHAEILKVYNTGWEAYLKGDLKTHASCLSKDFKIIGTSESEQFNSKKEWMAYCKKTIDQYAGIIKMKNRKIDLVPVGNEVMVIENLDGYVLIEKKWTFYSKFRITALMQKEKNGWKYINQHGSLPDARANEGEVIATEQVKKENLRLKEAVKRRTTELENKNKELEIETALEKVRSVAMGMKQPGDMLEICKTISLQLQSLGLQQIRNVQTAIFYEKKGTYMNYEYYARHDKAIVTETSYTNHQIHLDFASRMLKGKGEFFHTQIKGKKKLQDWIVYQKTINVFIDSFLESAKSLDYHWYSLGPVALGISTYHPLSEQEMNLFKRFLKVFELSYRRYLDIEQAEAQAREAQIQLALERVRARTMAMHKSDELQEVIRILSEQFLTLNFKTGAATFALNYKDSNDFNLWLSVPGANYITRVHIPYFDHPLFHNFISAKENGHGFVIQQLSFEEKNSYFKHFFENVPGSSEEEKNAVYNSAGYAGSEVLMQSISLGIANLEGIPYSEEENEILKRFAATFEQSYIRFADLLKAEALAREAQIEASLERVRSVAMSMMKTEDLAAICKAVFAQLQLLGFKNLRSSQIYIRNDEEEKFINYDYSDDTDAVKQEINYNSHANTRKIYDVIRNAGDELIHNVIDKEQMEKWKSYLYNTIGQEPEKNLEYAEELHYYLYSFGIGAFGICNFKSIPKEELQILKRFRNVFSLSYQRYTDISQAEAQAREAQIELGLERVRARAMAMQKSEELSILIATVYSELVKLEVVFNRCFIMIFDNTGGATWWMASHDAPEIQKGFYVKYHEHTPHLAYLQGWQNREEKWEYTFEGEVKKRWDDFLFGETELKNLPDFVIEGMRAVYKVNLSASFNTFGCLTTGSIEPLTKEAFDILLRFAKVFDLTYTRFNDLKQAEESAKEAQVQLALERVRARTMAMQKSSELSEVVHVLYMQMKELGFTYGAGTITLINEETGDTDWWMAGFSQMEYPDSYHVNWFNHPGYEAIINAWRRKEKFAMIEIAGESKQAYDNIIFEQTGFSKLPEEVKNMMKGFEKVVYSMSYMKYGILSFGPTPVIEDHKNVLQRFAAVFEQTYTRFLDLQKAEAQAREAQIEAALEKIRSRSLAMHHSDELKEVIGVVFEKLKELQITLGTVAIWLFDKQSMDSTFWVANNVQQPDKVNLPCNDQLMKEDTNYRDSWDAWLSGKEYINRKYNREQKDKYFEYVFAHNDLLTIPPSAREFISKSENCIASLIVEKNSTLYFDSWSGQLYDEAKINVFRRASKVFEQAYIRFLDLQKAEAQAREALIEAALEKVRSRTLAMQKSEELAETAGVLFQQLTTLGIEQNRLYISVIKDENATAEFWLTDEDSSKVITAYITNLNDNATLLKMYEGWKQQKKSLVIDTHGEELEAYLQHLSSLGLSFKGGLHQQRRVQDIAYFNKGFIGIASPEEQPAETLLLLERFAYVLNLMFTRFNDLKIAEVHAIQAEQDLIEIKAAREKAEEALTELQATQRQLIQSEKMASLGELTAGIAHEIQNPLNFVNNFSEVNKELAEELKAELATGNLQSATEIANDITENSEKINHHGKRAEAIVKGMLQHSRTSSGQKELIDINALCDEYLRLSYHGLRAKDKTFNATLKTDFDKSIGKINIIPQDMGRVILNLVNNAFYAVNEKKKAGIDKYEPVVSISTKKAEEVIELFIADNGDGIPQNIVDKIFQPFFTTKPTGQGTGLGLSLAYDIVKAHGGKLNATTTQGEGSKFIIQIPRQG